jgi:hypothetical protein
MLSALVAVVLLGVVGLSGCGDESHPAATSTAPAVTTVTSAPAPPPADPLPPPNALTDVLYRLADPNVPGAEKVGLVEQATGDEAAALDRFGKALQDNGFLPLTFDARDLGWSESEPGNVVATVNVTTANTQAGDFSFPMEFTQSRGAWQLTRHTANLLLELGAAASATPTR